MARFRRWYRRRYGARSFRRMRRYRRRYRRFINSTSRSRCRIKVPVQFNAQLKIVQNETTSNVLSVTPLYQNTNYTTASSPVNAALLGSVLNSPLFTSYCGLYDSFKIDGMKVAVAITSPVGVGGYPSLQVYTSWDRKFEYSDFSTSAAYPTVAKLKNTSSFLASTALNNSITKLTRSCYASDLFEKSSFADVDNQSQTCKILGTNAVMRYFGEWVPAVSGGTPIFKNPSFCPAFFLGVDTGSDVDTVNDRYVNFVIEVMYYVTFRNPKYGAASGGAKSEAVMRSVRFDSPLDDDGDMDDGPVPLIDVGDIDDDNAASASADDTPRRSVRSLDPKVSHAERVRRIQRAERAREHADDRLNA